MKDTLAIWDAVQKTDAAYTKDYQGVGGFSGTSVNATYLVRKATEQFGPCGKGWGYTVMEERFDEGGPLQAKEGEPVVMAKIHTIRLRLWYLLGGERCEVEHYGHTPYISRNKYGITTDSEAPKKSLTDALKKCLSMLGFAGDIHLGMYDDIHYVTEVRDESALAKADNKIEEKARQEAEYKEWIATNERLLSTAASMNELEVLYKSIVRKTSLRKDDTATVRMGRIKDARKTELATQQEHAA